MKKGNEARATYPLAALCLVWLITGCGGERSSSPSDAANNARVADYVAAFTSGEVSKRAVVRVELARNAVAAAAVGEPLAESPLSFDPPIAGSAQWRDRRTLEFTPAAHLAPGQAYTGALALERLFERAPDDLKSFQFRFFVTRRALDIQVGFLQHQPGGDLRRMTLEGAIIASDWEPGDEIERTLSADQEGVYLSVAWDHAEDGRTHRFTVSGVERRRGGSKMRLRWEDPSLGGAFRGSREIEVPPADSFTVSSAEVRTEPESHIVVVFTDPLREDQDLLGLIHIPGYETRLAIRGNQATVYPAARLTGEVVLQVEPGVENAVGAKLGQGRRFNLRFTEAKPQVRLAGAGAIVPSSDQVLFPFEAVNLTAVDLRVEKIYAHNVHQFLQNNTILGGYDLYRVADVALTRKVALDGDDEVDLKDWNRHAIDLSRMVRMEPGAVYRVSLGFRRAYSLYGCSEPAPAEADSQGAVFEPSQEADPSFWNYYQSYQYYSYRHRENPCHPAYYGRNTVVSRNVLASNIGLIAKGGDDGAMRFAATDLLTTEPLTGVDLAVYDFRKNQIAQAKTGAGGFAEIEFDREDEPFLLVASRGDQRGYLLLRDANALTLSRFDAGGVRGQKGLDGYLYGERGVWRPGDTLYLTFALHDKAGALPEDHPVAFELVDPRDRVVHRAIDREGVGGFYPFPVKTRADWPTGNYRARVRVGGALFERVVKIETIAPNRLKIALDLGRGVLRAGEGPIRADLAARWLHGAPARNLKADVAVRLRPVKTRFDAYADFSFDDPSRGFRSDERQVFQGKVDDRGQTAFSFELPVDGEAAGQLRADFVCKVFEPGGAFSVDRFSAPFHPYRHYAGVRTPPGDKQRGMLLTDRDHPVEIVTVDAEGKPVARKGLDVAVYKMSWRWWWEQGADQSASYNARQLNQPVQRGQVDTDANGEGRFNLRINYPDWGRYLIRVVDRDGHAGGKIVYVDWPGWAGRQRADQPGGAAMLTLSADRQSCVVGDTVTVNIPTGAAGRALVSLETGREVLQAQWLDVVEGVTRYSFQATAEMAPNVYAHVTLLQPHAQTANDLPIRLYGVLPILVEDPASRLWPVLDMADVLAPESEVLLRVSERHGRPMTYTVAVVDEGLLDLTRFKTPNPWLRFFAKQALTVKTWDLYDDVLGAFGGEIKTLLSIGGDAEAEETDTPKANRFKPVAAFLGPFELQPGQTAEHRVSMPRYVGSVRTMVVAGGDGAYGAVDKTTPVRKPLMLLGTLPRVLGPGEETSFPLSVFAMEEGIQQATVTIEANELLQPLGPQTQTLSFDGVGDKLAVFPLKVAPAVGVGRIKAVAVSGSERAEFEIELEVRNPNPYLRRAVTAIVQPGETWARPFEPVGMTGTNAGALEVSTVPPLNLATRLDYLIRYPHGCLEQTTSAAFPQLYLSALMDLPASDRAGVDANIREGLRRLAGHQTVNGGLAYWPGGPQADPWSTNYAGHFALEARRLGYQTPPGFVEKWLTFQRLAANSWNDGQDWAELTQAYRLYLLAVAEQAQLGAMNRFRERGPRRNVSRWLLAAAYHAAGQPEAAAVLARGLETSVADYTEMAHTYGSGPRDRAMILDAMNVLGHDGAVEMAERVSNALNDDRPYPTHTTAYGLIALGRYAGSGAGQALRYAYREGEGAWTDRASDKPMHRDALALDGSGQQRVAVRNDSDKRLYVNLALRGQPLAGLEDDASRNLKLVVDYRDLADRPIDPGALPQGVDFLARVTVYNPGGMGDYQELAISQIFPSGWEIHNQRLSAAPGESQPAAYEHRDIRDDRVYTYFDLASGKNAVFTVKLNASYTGRFYLPAVQAEAMYNHDVHAHRRGQWVTVAPAGDQ